MDILCCALNFTSIVSILLRNILLQRERELFMRKMNHRGNNRAKRLLNLLPFCLLLMVVVVGVKDGRTASQGESYP